MRAVSIVVAAAAITVVACKKPPRPAAPTAAAATPMPAEVFAIVTVPSLERDVRRFAAFVDAVTPGEGAELVAELDQDLQPHAIDGTRPVHIVLVAPPDGQDDPDVVAIAVTRDPAVTTAKVEDGEVVRVAGEWSVTGPPAAVDRVFAWATTTLVASPVPTRAKGVLFVPAIRARWKAELLAELDGDGSDVPPAVRDLVVGVLEDTERVEAFADLKDGDVVAEILLVPHAGTTLEALLAAQQPSTFALLERLPLVQPLGAMGGHLSLGPLAGETRNLLRGVIASELGASAPDLAQRLTALTDALFEVGTGEYAGVTAIASSAVVNVVGVSDAARVGASLDRVVDAVRALPLPPSLQIDVARATHAGTSVSDATVRAGAMVAATASWAAWDDAFAFTLTDPQGALLRRTIDGARAPAALPADLARALADARGRGDSLLLLFDVLAGDEHPLVLSAGVRTGAAYAWLRVSPAQAAAIATLGDDE